MSSTVIFAKALGIGFSNNKNYAGKLSFGNFIPSESVDITVLVDVEGKNLANHTLKGTNKRSLRDLLVDLKDCVRSLKNKPNKTFNKQVSMLSFMNGPLLQLI